MIREALVWLKTELGRGQDEAAVSWSDALEGSLNFWSLVEGTHLLSLMLFFGTIALLDLRMMGVTFRGLAFGRFSERVLPLTLAGFAIVVITGALLFFAKPVAYYHNIFFRLKLLLIVLALANIVVFHRRAQRDQAVWDATDQPPAGVRAAGLTSLVLWVAVIACGRFIPAAWFECGKPNHSIINLSQDCAASEAGAVTRGPTDVATPS